MSAPTFDIKTLGCVKNAADSDAMIERLHAAGFERDTTAPDLLLINTCSFLKIAAEQSIDAILDGLEAYGEAWEGKVVVCGCLPARYRQDLTAELPEVAAFVPCEAEDEIVSIAAGVLGCEMEDSDSIRAHSEYGSFAFLKISDGCNRRCSFCAIPYIRGPLVSRPYDDIAAEFHALAAHGVQEIVLVAQDTAAYGRDFPSEYSGCRTFAALLEALDELAAHFGVWLRVLYIQPDELTSELIDVFAHAKALLPYFDIPLQHTVEHILKSMGRLTTYSHFLEKVGEIKRKIPEATIRTTALVGYPGESDADFEQLLSDIRTAPIDYLAVFAYSQEDGTPAAEMPEQVSKKTKQARYQAMYDLSQEIGFQATKTHLGEVAEVILDGFEEDESAFYGHTKFQAPDTDGVTYIAGKQLASKKRTKALLEDAVCYDIWAEDVSE